MTPALYVGAAIVVVVGVAALDRLATRLVRPVPRSPDRGVSDPGVEHEDFTIPSGDHELAARRLRPSSGSSTGPLVLMAHGWGASYGTVLQLAEPLVERGHEVLVFDVRGHGRNEAVPYVTVRHFRDDVMAALAGARRRFPGRPLVLVGHSLGGAAGVLAAAEGAPVDGLVLIASPSDVLDVTAEFLTDRGMPGPLMVRVLRPFWWRKVGGSFRPLTPRLRIREIRQPILMIQPENDHRVHRRHADRLAAAAGSEYHLIEGREHTDVLAAPETLSLVLAFLDEV